MRREFAEVKIFRTIVHSDARGRWERIFDTEVLNLERKLVQISHSNNPIEGTLRGLHYQEEPYAERKLIKCIKGRIFDVIVDVRPDSSSYLDHQTIELHAADGMTILVPPGFAHGFLTLVNDCDLIYGMDESFQKESYKGLRWSDPRININWPIQPKLISEIDQNHELISG
jgi:dTDP-4-dehydrorhamnose 3,5-epimerase